MSKADNFGSKRNSNGFGKNPENINREGRPPSIKNELKEIIQSDGTFVIQANEIETINPDGSVVIKVPTKKGIALRLLQWALSKRAAQSLKAIQMILDYVDGKPKQSVDVNTGEQPIRIINIGEGIKPACN